MAEGFIVINRKIKGWRWWHNPTARIYELRNEGYQFDEKFETAKNRFGESVSFKRYRFQKETNGAKKC